MGIYNRLPNIERVRREVRKRRKSPKERRQAQQADAERLTVDLYIRADRGA